MPEKGPFSEQIYPSYHHHLHNQMLNGTASNGFLRSAGVDQQNSASAHFSTASNFPSAFVAFHNSQMASAANQRPTHENSFNPSSSFHYPHG